MKLSDEDGSNSHRSLSFTVQKIGESTPLKDASWVSEKKGVALPADFIQMSYVMKLSCRCLMFCFQMCQMDALQMMVRV